jgi:hypothetical protein
MNLYGKLRKASELTLREREAVENVNAFIASLERMVRATLAADVITEVLYDQSLFHTHWRIAMNTEWLEKQIGMELVIDVRNIDRPDYKHHMYLQVVRGFTDLVYAKFATE